MLWSTALITTLGIVTSIPGSMLAQTPRPSAEQLAELGEAERLAQKANQLYQQEKFTEAIPVVERIIAIFEKVLGSEHPLVATYLNNLGALYVHLYKYAQAEPLYQRSLAIREKAFGFQRPEVTNSLNNLANLYQQMGNYAQAEPLYQRALAIREKAFGSQHLEVAKSLNDLGRLYLSMGNYAQAESSEKRVLAIREKAFGSQHPEVARSLNNLAVLHHKMGKYAQAEPLYQQALAIREKAFGSDHPRVGSTLDGLAELYRQIGNSTKAESLNKRTLAIREKAFGSDHPTVGGTLHNLAELYRQMGNYAKAEPLYQRALAIYEKALGSEHPHLDIILSNLASLYIAQEDTPRAVEFQTRSVNLQEQNLAVNLTIGSESQKAAFMTTVSEDTNKTVSLHIQNAPKNAEAARLALTTVLRRKGRILEVLTNSLITLRQNLTPENQTLFEQLNATRSQLAALIFNKPENLPLEQYRNRVTTLKIQAEKQEAELARRSTEYRKVSQPATIEAVQKLIPQNTALIEFMLYKPYDAKTDKLGNPRYVAYLLNASGNIQWVDLGEAEPINQTIGEFRQALQSQSPNIQKIARSLDEKLMQPIRGRLGNTRTVLISPDSQLNLIPFAALVDENNRYLVENYSITYLGSGRDLLRLQNRLNSRSNPVLVANPDYSNPGNPSVQIANKNRGINTRRSSDLAQIKFGSLPGTLKEAEAIAPLLSGVEQLTGSQATENALKQVKSPSILHIATHGFFLEDVELVALPTGLSTGDGRSLWVEPDFSVKPRPRLTENQENPLLRSGLAMAGFNIRQSGDEDGVLTAMEAAALNLSGTKLVVLSACETGVGYVANGEGVFGLRRAFAIAGAESQVLSLWKVDDEGTKDLMVNYYRRLLNNEERFEALRQIQLEMLRSQKYQHPYYWAAFIPSGDWTPMRSISQ
jgi:CHAT domain-containing protein/Tfp pilus assembly protein PilF